MKHIKIILLLTPIIFCSFALVENEQKLKSKIEKQYAKITAEQCTAQRVETTGSSSLAHYHLTNSHGLCGYALIRKAKGCQIGGCILPDKHLASDAYEHFYYLLLFDKKKSVLDIKILKYEPEYGYEISNKKWLSQFIGYSTGTLEYGKDIDAIAGATTSAYSMVEDIQLASKEIHCTLLSQ